VSTPNESSIPGRRNFQCEVCESSELEVPEAFP
jgi:hypothetical protein